MVLVAMECCHCVQQQYAATGGIPEELLILPPGAIQSWPFNSKRSRLPNPAVRGGMATPVGETGSKVRFARQELTCWQNASAIKVNHLKSMNKSDVLDFTIAINQLDG
jgi:hypothetical protein